MAPQQCQLYANFGRATTCRTRVFGPKAIGKVGSARLLASRDSAGDGGVAASRVTVEEASMESEWLKVKLKQWLDDEYCPEPANEDISERCKRVYYRCLLEGVNDAGDILVEFIRDLETFSFKESFHGPFTAANAAIALIMERIDTQDS
ncbi:hypothetical protein KFL_009790010 [Klebsormidium nitens]|uniref:Uncharacterized protein n=1 Tax=Klebsormidium nitens TaxID=105231 RepID=A0A1Y1IS20_KLENI|nr:hypothetical protein KFL_009790010 [Klebsormidium nitens]|eukprot:GAQ92319.1 hypothetical protein KFL_009790010 [Klebsormidium nitens]